MHIPPANSNRAADQGGDGPPAGTGVLAVPHPTQPDMPSPGALPATAPAMPGVIPLLRQRLRGRFAALSVIGGVMVLLPLVQVLRYQNAEVHSLVTERAGLDPAARAVDVQRSLLVHRDVAGDVLRGQAALEAERLVRQGEVDDRVGALAVALANGAWNRAIKESDALRDDWSLLARQVAQHSVSAVESDQAHRLLIEQSLQVVDLVAHATLPRAGGRPELADAGNWWRPTDGGSWWALADQDLAQAGARGGGTLATLAAAQALPRLAWQLALLAAPVLPGADRSPATVQRELAAAEADVARALGAMNAAVERQRAPTEQLTLAHAAAGAGAAADHYFALLRTAQHDAATAAATVRPAAGELAAVASAAASDLQSAAGAAVQAQLQLFDMARRAVDDQLGEQTAAAELRRSLFVSAMAVLALAALALISSLARRLQRWQQAALQAMAAAEPATASQPAVAAAPSEMQHLLQRLRSGDGRLGRKRQAQAHESQSTSPPEN